MENQLEITTTHRALLEELEVLFEDDGVFFPKGTIVFPQEIISTFSSGATSSLRFYQLPSPHFVEVTVTYLKTGNCEHWIMSVPTQGPFIFSTSRNTSPDVLKLYEEFSNSCLHETWGNEYSDFPVTECRFTIREESRL